MVIYICDDDLTQLAELKRLTISITYETDQVYTCTTSNELLQLLSKSDPTNACVISDIKLIEGDDGIYLTRKINLRYPQIPVILCTAYLNYVKDIWNANLCSLLTKPVKTDALRHTLEKARKTISKDIISVTNKGGIQRIYKRDIRYIERKCRTSFLYLAPSVAPILTSENLDQLHRRLDFCAFCKIHRSYIVNLYYVKRISGGELMLDGIDIILTVSRSMHRKLLQALADYEGANSYESV